VLRTRTSASHTDPWKLSQHFRIRRCTFPRRGNGRSLVARAKSTDSIRTAGGPPILSGFHLVVIPPVESYASGHRRFRKRKYIAVFARSVFLVCAIDVVVTIRSRLQHLKMNGGKYLILIYYNNKKVGVKWVSFCGTVGYKWVTVVNCVKFKFNDMIPLYKKNDSERTLAVSQPMILLSIFDDIIMNRIIVIFNLFMWNFVSNL